MFGINKNMIRCVVVLSALLLASPIVSWAQQNAVSTQVSNSTDPYDTIRYILIVIAAVLALVIGVIGNAVIVTGRMFWEKQKDNDENKSNVAKVIVGLAALLFANNLCAQNKPSTTAATNGSSIPSDIYIFLSVIGVELLVIFSLMYFLSIFLDKKKAMPVAVVASKPKVSWFQKVNKTVPLEEEHTLDLHHEYDGIRELDNNIPGWWKLAFLGTFLFGVIYAYRLYISESMPNQRQELAIAYQEADIQKLEYLKDAANNIDENNVVALDSMGVMAGRELFLKNCVACHGDKGQGNVGPNFTDEYWLHGGSINKIFYSIKYGWQEKGMRSWKDDFSPQQMAQLASFIHSLKNTHVPGGKDKQGDLYEEVASNSVGNTSSKN